MTERLLVTCLADLPEPTLDEWRAIAEAAERKRIEVDNDPDGPAFDAAILRQIIEWCKPHPIISRVMAGDELPDGYKMPACLVELVNGLLPLDTAAIPDDLDAKTAQYLATRQIGYMEPLTWRATCPECGLDDGLVLYVRGEGDEKYRREFACGCTVDRLWLIETAQTSQTDSRGRRVSLTTASSIRPEAIHWLWEGRIPLGNLTLVAGPGGLGKSTLVYDLAAQVTRGQLEGEHLGRPEIVLVVATEDDWATTIVPRLTAAGANLNRIMQFNIRQTVKTGDVGGVLDLPGDIHLLRDAIERSNASLVILDPLMSRIGSNLDTYKDSSVRQALEPLTEIARDTRASVVGIMHLNKTDSADPLARIVGSGAFVNVARSVLAVLNDPDDETEQTRLVCQAKTNLSQTAETLRFTIEDAFGGIDWKSGLTITTGKVTYQGCSKLSAKEVLERSKQSSEERTARKDAAEWLIDRLRASGGIEDSSVLKADAKKEQISLTTLARARKEIGVEIGHTGKLTTWALPAHAPQAPLGSPPTPPDSHYQNDGIHGTRGIRLDPDPPVPPDSSNLVHDEDEIRLI